MYLSVPCGYRDIPAIIRNSGYHELRSLWVQGYTALVFGGSIALGAFPVGTGIYRKLRRLSNTVASVPCGYRDIP